MIEVGSELFKAVFQSSEQGRLVWADVRKQLNDLRVEVVTDVQAATAIPWELLYDPHTEIRLALEAAAFVRTQRDTAVTPRPVDAESGPIRILLVICRPRQGDDVPFRSVAGKLVKALTDESRAAFQLDVLRPPTFERLARVLRDAKSQGKPYHVVHFDGHGMYAKLSTDDAPETDNAMAAWLQKLIPLVLDGPREGPHGYLLFENPTAKSNALPVGGGEIGKLLHETEVPLLVLNACRSAHAESPSQPKAASSSDEVHAQVRALGSLAQEVIDAGVTGVVAMRYNVYVVTAAQFVADMYSALVGGATFGEAVSLGRKQLAAEPARSIAYTSRPLQDWCVPIVYEALPTRLFPQQTDDGPMQLTIDAAGSAAEAGQLDAKLPKPPDAGFFGRDETLLALDRAFDSQSIVLLHAYAGSGKTATSAEFARWYALTGGVQGPVLFTSFEQYLPLPRVLDRLGEVFGPMLEQAGENWLAMNDARRRKVALQVLTQFPVLWIWDNVEPVAGFPAGTDSAWSDEEQRELVDFLRDAAATKAKFLLTSRRDERPWLGDELPRRIPIAGMPMQERVQLARALAEKQGRSLIDVDDWRPLLRFTGGNPLTITVLVGQALRDGLKTRDQIEAFVARLQSGQAAFEDETDQGRSRSLGASLAYGFESAFSDAQRAQLACLHFFQGFVDVDALKAMGNLEADWCLPELRGMTREAAEELLDRAAEIGLLTSHGGGYYTIHPALPWFFKTLFDQYYPPQAQALLPNPQSAIGNRQLKAARAYVEAIGGLGNYYHDEYERGNRDVIAVLQSEEANLLQARRLARTNEWWRGIISTMQGLQTLYGHTGRRAEWSRLIEEIIPDFVDPDTDGPFPGREKHWSLVNEYRVGLAREARQWTEAERLQRILVDWNRQQAAPLLLKRKPKELDDAERFTIRSLATALHLLAEVRRELGQPECVTVFEEALALAEGIGNRSLAAICAFNLGRAYEDIGDIRDLEQAEKWYRQSLERYDERDQLGRACSLGQLGSVAYERFKEAREGGASESELLCHINQALKYYREDLEMLPENAVNNLAVVHEQLGSIYGDVGDIDRAMTHYRDAIRLEEAAGNVYAAAETRLNVAIDLANAARLADARDYARAALENYRTFGDGAADMIQKTEKLLAEIEAALQSA
ncbi:MAG: CHAT domain-containing protein [Planctomycetes bacterium]|nr:CHAT domain-containing protein [Planctomycetota bacterium]